MLIRCQVGGCGWTASGVSSVGLERVAEHHRRGYHFWVKPGRCCTLTPLEQPAAPVVETAGPPRRRSRGHI